MQGLHGKGSEEFSGPVVVGDDEFQQLNASVTSDRSMQSIELYRQRLETTTYYRYLIAFRSSGVA